MTPLSFSDQSQKANNTPIKVLEVSKKEVKEVSPVVPVVPTVSITPASVPVPSLAVPQTPVKTNVSAPVQTKTPVKPVDEGYKKKLIEYISKIDEIMKSTSGEIGKIQVASQKTNNTICESSDIIKNSLNDSKNVLNELMNLVKSIEEMTEKSTHAVKDLDFVVDEQMTMISEAANPENVIDALRDHAEAQKLMKFNKFETSADLLNEKYVQCCELLRKIRYGLIEKESKRKSMLISPLTSGFLNHRLESQAETETALKVMRNVSKIIMDTKERVQKNEIMLARAKKENKGEIKKEVIEEKSTSIGYIGIESQTSRNLTKEQIVSARQTLLRNFKSKGPVKTKKVNLISFSNIPANQSTTTNNTDLSTANLTNAILKLSMTPRRQPIHNNTSIVSTPSRTCDATTQADAPPVVITVKEEEPKSPPPLLVKPKEQVKLKEDKTPVASNSMFSGSLFGSKKDTPTTPSTSLFGSLKPAPPVTTTVPSSNISLLPAKTTTAPSAALFSSPTLTSKTTVTQPIKPLTATTNQEVTTSPHPAVSTPAVTVSPVTVPSVPVSANASDAKTEPVSEPTVKPASTVVPKTEEPVTASPIATTVPAVTSGPPSTVSKPAEVIPETVKVEEPVAVSADKTAEPKKEPIFAFGQSTKTPEPAKPTENTISTPKSAISFGSAVSNQATPKTLFGGSSTATPSSLFGGAASKPEGATSSPFGMFGQQQNTAQASTAPSQSVGFSFNKPAANPVFGGISQPSKPTGFAAAAAAAAAASNDIGMEDDTSGASFGSGFMSGLGSSSTNQNSGGNIFSSKPAASSTSSGNSWLFGGGGGQNKPAATNSFSFASAAAQHAQQPTPQQNSSAMFGGGAKFGGAPAFGSKPAFGGGAAPGGGFLSKDASIFGGTANSGGGGAGFSQFASSSPNTSSLFGGGTTTSNSAASSLFGGSASNSKGNFNSWR